MRENMDSRNRGLFLDRDGTLIEHIPYLSDPDGVRILPGVREMLLQALQRGFHLFLLTNQSGVGRGYYTMEDVVECNDRMLQELDLPFPGFTEICIAPEAPGELSAYRKPSPRFILEMMEKYGLDPAGCYMLGDSDCDYEAGRNAGIQALKVPENGGLAELAADIEKLNLIGKRPMGLDYEL